MQESQIKVHQSHCCILHWCKYCSEDCPVMNDTVKQTSTCEDCDHDGIETVQQARLYHMLPYLQHCNRALRQLKAAKKICDNREVKNKIREIISNIKFLELSN